MMAVEGMGRVVLCLCVLVCWSTTGHFICQASPSVRHARDVTAIRFPLSTGVVEGSAAILTCETDNRHSTVSWLRGGRKVTSGRHGIVLMTSKSPQSSRSVLRIDSTNIKLHKRNFTCVVQKAGGIVSEGSAYLTVYKADRTPSAFPVFFTQPSSSSHPIGRAAVFPCLATTEGRSLGREVYRWFKDKFFDVFTLDEFQGRIEIGAEGDLTIRNFEKADAGTYECVVTDTIGMIVSSAASVAYIDQETCKDRNDNIVEKGQHYQPGDDPCEKCQCKSRADGQDSCVFSYCARPDCNNFTMSKDVCCEFTCHDDGPSSQKGTTCTDRKGQTVQLDQWYEAEVSDPCFQCRCHEEGVADTCTSVMCSAPTCKHFRLNPDQCCGFVCLEQETCKDKNNNTIEKGQQYQPGDDPCTTCWCKSRADGQDSCVFSYCARPDCNNFTISKDVCCEFTCHDDGPSSLKETCKDKNNNTIEKGKKYQPGDDSCTTCWCKSRADGQDSCVFSYCARPDCNNFTMSKDVCCEFTCYDDGPSTVKELPCTDRNGEKVKLGQIYQSSVSEPCVTCVCGKEGPTLCSLAMCDAPLCTNYRRIPDTCCGFECLEAETCTDRNNQTVLAGEIYLPNSDPCHVCRCQESCVIALCERPACTDFTPSTDVCCQYSCNEPESFQSTDAPVQHIELAPSTCTDRNGQHVQLGQEYQPEADRPCVTCVCVEEGVTLCSSIICDPPVCNYRYKPGTCCDFECIVPDNTCLDRRNKTIQMGELYLPTEDPCDQCLCKIQDGEDVCVNSLCPRPTCYNSVKSTEVCCEYACREPLELIVETCTDRSNKTIQKGQKYIPGADPCHQCTCKTGSNSQDVCLSSYCQKPNCDIVSVSQEVCCEFTCRDDGPSPITEPACIDRKGSGVKLGQIYKANVSDPCFTCVCGEDGPKLCSTAYCSAPSCSNYRLIPETCCGFECIEPATCTDRNNQTVHQGELYLPKSDPCYTCTCGGAASTADSCVFIGCRPPSCEQFTLSPDVCCEYTCIGPEEYRSPVSESVPPTCTDRKGQPIELEQLYKANVSDPCDTCVCGEDGPMLCSTAYCSAPSCSNYRLIPDTCCGFECIEPDVTCTDRQHKTVPKGELYLPTEDPCKQCQCKEQDGEDLCVYALCPRPTCDNFDMSTEVCCEYTCREPLELVVQVETCTDRNNKTIQKGHKYITGADPCHQCTCKAGSNSQDVCVSSYCQKPNCDIVSVSQEVCCEFTCRDDGPSPITAPACIDRKGSGVKLGQIYKAKVSDPCFTCVCGEDGPKLCNTALCSAPSCSNYRLIPETCCGFECIEPVTCIDRHNQTVMSGVIYVPYSDNPCYMCTCEDTDSPTKTCMSTVCEPPSCDQFTPSADVCCEYTCIGPEEYRSPVSESVPSTCTDRKGQPIELGQIYEAEKSDPCVTCVCGEDGPMLCSTAYCSAPSCSNYRLIPETCCGFECIEQDVTCTDRQNKTVTKGELYLPTEDPCKQCQCKEQDGEDLCVYALCPRPTCDNFDMSTEVCCEYTCMEPLELVVQVETCTDRNNKTIQKGQKYIPGADPCHQCTCKTGSNSQDVCLSSYCQKPNCDIVSVSQEVCCEFTCRDDGPSPITGPACIDRKGSGVKLGQIYKANVSDPCVTCVCGEDGPRLCSTAYCSAPTCRNYRLIPDTCCGFECIEPDTCSDRNKKSIRIGEIYLPSSDPCYMCICQENSAKTCMSTVCEPPPCPRFTSSPDVCCEYTCIGPERYRSPEALELRSSCTDGEGQHVRPGQLYRPQGADPCERCVCSNEGPRMCATAVCDAPPCANYRLLPGVCCGFECIEADVTCTNRDGREVQQGETYLPTRDACIQCLCKVRANGEDSCMAVTCAKPTCVKFVMSTEVCCEYTCTESTEAVSFDVRQLGSDNVLLQWKLPDGVVWEEIEDIDVFYSGGFDDQEQPWNGITVRSLKNVAILRALDCNKLYHIKLVVNTKSEREKYASTMRDFSLDCEVDGHFIEISPNKMAAGVYINSRLVKDTEYLNINYIHRITVSTARCSAKPSSYCFILRCFIESGETLRIEFEDEQDFVWLTKHF